MLDTSTFYLILTMAAFLFVATIIIHYHANTDKVRRKKGEVEAYTAKTTQKIAIIEAEIATLKEKKEQLDEEIESLKV
ncbi:hypothetical protein [Pseudodesulfovibrio piezophilus]|uniref:Uncharacterized protein n=1 Tax=Pseudodesulfovibrio piezophilus (strain DSM 21447 / JCM 15486 / C1TLV30) TaxID=1322246 RepID=M1WPY9_PSEP2|nr:hypothetical protein [Pseudodesulfovibrio piezophilus]CCH47357.1 conserved exported protein of unknown function [Pseudodesulfovibrio piezophilus C1TLV30]